MEEHCSMLLPLSPKCSPILPPKHFDWLIDCRLINWLADWLTDWHIRHDFVDIGMNSNSFSAALTYCQKRLASPSTDDVTSGTTCIHRESRYTCTRHFKGSKIRFFYLCCKFRFICFVVLIKTTTWNEDIQSFMANCVRRRKKALVIQIAVEIGTTLIEIMVLGTGIWHTPQIL